MKRDQYLDNWAGGLGDSKISAAKRTARFSRAPEIDQKNDEKRGQTQPREHNDLDPQFANGRNVVVHIRISVKEAMAIKKECTPLLAN